jgi:protein involved in polysaccharide export with SLBB domain
MKQRASMEVRAGVRTARELNQAALAESRRPMNLLLLKGEGRGEGERRTEHFVAAAPLGTALAVLLLVLVAGCHSTPPTRYADMSLLVPPSTNVVAMNRVSLTNQFNPSWLQPPTDLFTLGPGDRLELELLGEPLSKTTTVVGPDGKLYFDILPGIDVWGMTPAQAKDALEAELGKFIRQQPQVSMTLRAIESKRVWILGRVQAPGVYPISTPMTLLEAVSVAGGTMSLSSFQDQSAAGIAEELADLRRSFVIRQGKVIPINFERLIKQGDISQNIYVQPDDFVYFPAATSREVYVLGAVQQPRPVPYTEGLTVAGAVASAYGTLDGAYMHHVAVVRGSLAEPELTIVDYKRVIRGEALDMELQPNDIVYVPFSPYRYIQRYLEIIVNTFASSAAINAGSQAVTKQPTGGAGVFIPVGSGIQVIPPIAPPPPR